MKNVKVSIKGTKMTLEVDLSKDQGPSKSGKTIIIATTSGNADVPGMEGAKMSLNVFKYSTS